MKKVEDLEHEVKAKDQRIVDLEDQVKSKEDEVEQLKEKSRQAESRIGELEKLKVTAENRTLKETEELLLRAQDNEIKRKAESAFTQMKLQWERNTKPKEVLSEAIKWLKHTVEELSKQEPRFFLREVADVGLPEKVEEIMDSEVRKRVDTEFLRKVEEKSKQEALAKLADLKSVEWPEWYRTNVGPRIIELESRAKGHVMTMLVGPWTIKCDKCGTDFHVELAADTIEALLREGLTWIKCENTNCKDLWARHRIKTTLGSLIDSYISSKAS